MSWENFLHHDDIMKKCVDTAMQPQLTQKITINIIIIQCHTAVQHLPLHCFVHVLTWHNSVVHLSLHYYGQFTLYNVLHTISRVHTHTDHLGSAHCFFIKINKGHTVLINIMHTHGSIL